MQNLTITVLQNAASTIVNLTAVHYCYCLQVVKLPAPRLVNACTVKISERYITTGSFLFSPIGKAVHIAMDKDLVRRMEDIN